MHTTSDSLHATLRIISMPHDFSAMPDSDQPRPFLYTTYPHHPHKHHCLSSPILLTTALPRIAGFFSCIVWSVAYYPSFSLSIISACPFFLTCSDRLICAHILSLIIFIAGLFAVRLVQRLEERNRGCLVWIGRGLDRWIGVRYNLFFSEFFFFF
jgi:hypothetical protein